MFPDGICTARNSIVFAAGTCSIFSYLTMAVQRFLAIVFNKNQLKVIMMILLLDIFVIVVVYGCYAAADDDEEEEGEEEKEEEDGTAAIDVAEL